jgi:hypothetical protein
MGQNVRFIVTPSQLQVVSAHLRGQASRTIISKIKEVGRPKSDGGHNSPQFDFGLKIVRGAAD